MNHSFSSSQLRPVRDAAGTVATVMALLAAVHLLWEPISPTLWGIVIVLAVLLLATAGARTLLAARTRSDTHHATAG